ncbi:hypothetical protein MHH70_12370 [Metasolibacillus sp. FSL H7-0170]|uniref:hypothetical protein n=1 Tax=Metasolibacillus sp. FSL H7-0170 TaxID=2921431 RepID=UPI0031596A9E
MNDAKFRRMVDEIESKEFELLSQKLSLIAEKAYLQGLEDGRAKDRYPHVLRKAHLCEILQIEMPTVNKLVARKDFPKLIDIQARYPRDQVFDWINRNSNVTNMFMQIQRSFA